MWLLRSFWALVVVMGLGAGLCQAQEPVIVLLDTNLPGAIVYADSARLGPASQGTFLVPAQTRQLRLVPPGGSIWTIAPVTAPFSASAGDTLELRLAFPYHYQIETIPYGASVFLVTPEGRATIVPTMSSMPSRKEPGRTSSGWARCSLASASSTSFITASLAERP